MLLNCFKTIIIILLLSSNAFSDVIVKWKSKRNFGNMITTFEERTEYIKGDKSRNEIETKIESTIIQSEDGGGLERTTHITILEKGIHWYLMPSQKKYIEKDLPFYKLGLEEKRALFHL